MVMMAAGGMHIIFAHCRIPVTRIQQLLHPCDGGDGAEIYLA